MAAVTVHAIQDERIDQVAQRIRGSQIGTVERILNASYGLAAEPVKLPLATPVTVPDVPPVRRIKAVRLWSDR